MEVQWVIVYTLISAVCVSLVSHYGPLAIKNYVLENRYDTDNGPANVTYRIVSPVVCCFALVLVASSAGALVGLPSARYCWVSVLEYWTIMLVVKLAKRTMTCPWYAFVLEIVASCAIAYMFSAYVMDELLGGNVGVLDSSGIALEMEVAVLGVVAQTIASVVVRRQYSVEWNRLVVGELGPANHSDGVDVSEKKLFAYERKYGELLPRRFEQDILLRSLFFTIMAVEDYNRPAGYRCLERLAAWLGAAKTTGIMQQGAEHPLSDEYSVRLAIPYIEDMWDSFLVAFARSSESESKAPAITFAAGWYEYDYRKVSAALSGAAGSLYGDYCGTRLLDISGPLYWVRTFEEDYRYGMPPASVMAEGSLCSRQIEWMGGGQISWSGGYEVINVGSLEVVQRVKTGGLPTHFVSREGATENQVDSLCAGLRKAGCTILQVKWLDGVFARIFCCGDCMPSVDGWCVDGERV